MLVRGRVSQTRRRRCKCAYPPCGCSWRAARAPRWRCKCAARAWRGAACTRAPRSSAPTAASPPPPYTCSLTSRSWSVIFLSKLNSCIYLVWFMQCRSQQCALVSGFVRILLRNVLLRSELRKYVFYPISIPLENLVINLYNQVFDELIQLLLCVHLGSVYRSGTGECCTAWIGGTLLIYLRLLQ